MNSLKKTAKTLDTVFKLFKILLVIACVASIVVTAFVAAVLLFDVDTESLGMVDQILQLGDVQLTLAQGYSFSLDNVLYVSLVEMAVLVITAIAGLVAVGYIRTILHPMTEGEPFRNIVAVTLKKLAWLQIAYGVLRFFLDGAEAFLVTHFYADTLSELIEGSGISHIAYEKEGSLGFLLVAGVLFLLSYVFRYAEELQKLSDETL